MTRKVLIVGGVAGGASAAARLRRLDENMEIILFERGGFISFANCGLPYYIGGEIPDEAALSLQTPQSFRHRFRVDVRVRNEVLSIDRTAKTVRIRNLQTNESYDEAYDKLILAPGAAPFTPDIAGICSERVFTLRDIPDTRKIKEFIQRHKPRSALIAGGGMIGVEMAENLCAAGLSVTLAEPLDQVVAALDYDMACDVRHHMESKGVRLLLQNSLKSVEDHGGGLSVTLGEGTLQTDMLIVAAGVRPDTAFAAASGLAVNERGAIVTGDDMCSSDPHIYAVGDAAEITDFVTGQKGTVPLAGPANKQGRIAADRICGLESRYAGTQGSAILRVFDMTAAMTGINEKTAKRLGLDYEKSFTYSANHAGYFPGAVNMSVKLLFERRGGKILGAQIVGFDGVDKRCDVLAVAIRAGMTVYDLTRLELCYAPPYSSAKDPVNMAGFVAENVLNAKVKLFHWHETAALPRDGSVTLLDVRSAREFAHGTIDGFVNIPVDELRDRLGELSPSKPVYVTCQVGLRGYIAARILMQKGFDVYNLSGGFRLCHSVAGHKAAPPDPIGTKPANTCG